MHVIYFCSYSFCPIAGVAQTLDQLAASEPHFLTSTILPMEKVDQQRRLAIQYQSLYLVWVNCDGDTYPSASPKPSK